MLRINLKPIFAIKGLENPSLFLQENGIARNTVQKLLTDKIRHFNPKLIEHLCLIFHCTPNDLMQWVPDHPEQVNEPLRELIRAETIDLRKFAVTLPLDKASELAKIIAEFKKETVK